MLEIGQDGRVSEDNFSYTERADVLKRVNYVTLASASPVSLGYKSLILQIWPNLFFPLLYPWASGAAGALLLSIGGIWAAIDQQNKQDARRFP